MVFAAGELSGEAAEPQRIERLDHPSFGPGLLREERVGLAVEQQPDRTVQQPIESLFLSNGKASGDAAHVADLEIEQDEIRLFRLDHVEHDGARSNPPDCRVVSGKCGIDLVVDGI